MNCLFCKEEVGCASSIIIRGGDGVDLVDARICPDCRAKHTIKEMYFKAFDCAGGGK